MEVFYTTLGIFFDLWWLWLPVFLIVTFVNLWVLYLKVKATKKLKWVLLEVRVSRDIEKTPRAMEQVFSGLHGVLAKIKFLDKYWKGKVQEWFSLEMAGINGVVYFFIRTTENFRNLVEAQVHAQYPNAEIMEVLDYAAPLAKMIPGETYEIGGAELILDKPDFYPIRTYPAFEERQKERRLDPMASFLEILSKLGPNENIFIQYLVRPTGEKDWINEGLEAVNKLVGRKTETKQSWIENLSGGIHEFVVNLLKAIAVYPEWSDAKKEETKTAIKNLSPGERLIAEAIEAKISKLAFRTLIRFAYIAEKSVFSPANIPAIVGAFKQFNTLNLNSFAGNKKGGTKVNQPRIIPFIQMRREFVRKLQFIDRFVNRKMTKNKLFGLKDFILNTEELATIYHYPIVVVETPTMRRVEAKKSEPPVSLPIE